MITDYSAKTLNTAVGVVLATICLGQFNVAWAQELGEQSVSNVASNESAASGGKDAAVAISSGWKIPPDPEIVNFKRADAEVVTQTLVAPPFLPDHEQVADGPPKLVKIRMDIVEREVEIAPGAFVWQMAFDNSVPGPVPVVHQYDWVELTLHNGAAREAGFTVNDGAGPNVTLHNVDFHASMVPWVAASLLRSSRGQRWCLPGGP